MGVTRIQNLMRVRDLLDNPLPNRPSAHQIFRQLLREEMDIVNETNNTGKPWALKEYQLNYTPNTSDYAINVEDFGKVLYVVRVQGDPYIRFLNVPFDDVNTAHYGTIWQNWYGNAYGVVPWASETPERMSFYRSGVLNAQAMVKIQPLPQQSWTYIVHYIPGYIGTQDPLETATQLPEMAELLRYRVAGALLSYAEWGDDKAENREKRKELALGFTDPRSRKEAIFSKYVKSIAIPKTVDIEGWNS